MKNKRTTTTATTNVVVISRYSLDFNSLLFFWRFFNTREQKLRRDVLTKNTNRLLVCVFFLNGACRSDMPVAVMDSKLVFYLFCAVDGNAATGANRSSKGMEKAYGRRLLLLRCRHLCHKHVCLLPCFVFRGLHVDLVLV